MKVKRDEIKFTGINVRLGGVETNIQVFGKGDGWCWRTERGAEHDCFYSPQNAAVDALKTLGIEVE